MYPDLSMENVVLTDVVVKALRPLKWREVVVHLVTVHGPPGSAGYRAVRLGRQDAIGRSWTELVGMSQ